MDRLTCTSCEATVTAPRGKCARCGNRLYLLGAVTVHVDDPTPPDDGASDGPESAATTPRPGVTPTEAGPEVPADAQACATPDCGRPAAVGQRFCGRCLRDPSAQARSLTRTFRVLTPWSEVIAIPDGTVLAIGRDPGFCQFADRLADSCYMSRQHLFLSAKAGRLFVRDLVSHNGTARNGDRLTTDTEVELVTNDAITLGGQETFFVVV